MRQFYASRAQATSTLARPLEPHALRIMRPDLSGYLLKRKPRLKRG